MKLIITIISSVGPLVLGIFISTLTLPNKTKIIVWIICVLISISSVFRTILDWKKEKKKEKKEKKEEKTSEYYCSKIEKMELVTKGLPMEYINGLGDNPELKHYLKKAKQYEEESNYNKAIEEYKKCLSHPRGTNDNLVAAYISIGNCYYKMSRLEEAENSYKNSIAISKKVKNKLDRLKGKARALSNIGSIYRDRCDFDKAIKYHKLAYINYKKRDCGLGITISLDYIGLSYLAKGDLHNVTKYYKSALKTFKKSIELDANNHIAWVGKGESLKQLGRFEEAAKAFNKAIELKSDFFEAWNNRGIAYYELGFYKEALKDFEKTIRLKSDLFYAFYNKGNALSGLRRFKESIEAYDKALELNPDYAEAWNNKGVSLRDLKNDDEALNSFNKAIELKSDYPEALINRANLYLLRGDKRKAFEYLYRAIKLGKKWKEEIKKDEDFKNLLKDENFKRVASKKF